ncbi:hypothetical protein [Actinospica robiniae]|uniref:hypothetical protein n=1 Tax=Actinospica robiniae TaxID=304901 RepID=UPI00040F7542|nr:hypothetical protein [Actinospica robiniae]
MRGVGGMDARSVLVSNRMTWQWLYFMHAETSPEDLLPPAVLSRPAAWDPSLQEQWEELRERYAAELLAPPDIGSDPVEFRQPPGMDEPEFASLHDLPELRAWCVPLWPAFCEWDHGRQLSRSRLHGDAPGNVGLSPMQELRARLPANRAVRIVEVASRKQRVLHRCRTETPTGTVVGLVVTAALLADDEFFTGACRRELFE